MFSESGTTMATEIRDNSCREIRDHWSGTTIEPLHDSEGGAGKGPDEGDREEQTPTAS